MTEAFAMTLIFCLIGFIIMSSLFGWIMKHFIREAIKEAYEDLKLNKRNTEQDW